MLSAVIVQAEVTLGRPAPASARPASPASWCAQHPGRQVQGAASALSCRRVAPGAGGGGLECATVTAELFAYGELVEQDSDTAQCCLYVDDGGVVGKYVGFD